MKKILKEYEAAARSLGMFNVNIMALKGSVEAAPKMLAVRETLDGNGLEIERAVNQNSVESGIVECIAAGRVYLERLGLG